MNKFIVFIVLSFIVGSFANLLVDVPLSTNPADRTYGVGGLYDTATATTAPGVSEATVVAARFTVPNGQVFGVQSVLVYGNQVTSTFPAPYLWFYTSGANGLPDTILFNDFADSFDCVNDSSTFEASCTIDFSSFGVVLGAGDYWSGASFDITSQQNVNLQFWININTGLLDVSAYYCPDGTATLSSYCGSVVGSGSLNQWLNITDGSALPQQIFGTSDAERTVSLLWSLFF